MTHTMTGGELLLRCLHQERVERIHAITDGTYMLFLEALERLGPELGMRLVVPRHEAAAAHFADAETRVTGTASVVMACAGPGAANLLSGLICAQAEGSPVVAITTTRRSDIGDAYVHQAGMQVGNQHDYYKAAVKWSGKVEHFARLPDMVRHAFRVALSGRPGPVHLLIPQDILDAVDDASGLELQAPDRYRVVDPATASAGPAQIRRAAELLAESRLLNIHAGNGAERAGAGEVVTALAEHLGMPITLSVRAHSVVSSDHPQVLHPGCPVTYLAHQEADTILVIGSRLGEMAAFGKAPAWGDPSRTRTVQIDSEATNIGLNRPVDVALVGDAQTITGQLLEEVRRLTGVREPHPRIADYAELQAAWRKSLDEVVEGYGDRLCVGSLVSACDDYFEDDAILTVDGGNTAWWTLNAHANRVPGLTLHSSQYGHLGSGFPYAIGAQLARPDATVYCITGDSAFAFNMQELETAVREKLPVIILVAVDGAWGMEKTAQLRSWNREAPWFCIEHSPVRYDRVCEAMGGHGEYVETRAELRPALDRARASGKPAVLHCAILPESNIHPPGIEVWNAVRAGKADVLFR